jgi:hypothetical protein
MAQRMCCRLIHASALALASLCAPLAASAQPPPEADSANAVPEAGPVPIAPAPAPAKPPYSIPFQLRPAASVTVLRTDTSFAFYDDPVADSDGTTVASMLLASYKLTDNLCPLIRVGMV